MSFFYREQTCGRTVYHWHKSCQLVPGDLGLRPEWVTAMAEPRDRVRCRICAELDRSAAADEQLDRARATTPSIPGALRRRSTSP